MEKLLLVDDEEGIRKVLGIALRDLGYEVFTAKDGPEALRVFQEERPPIVLTDIKMPGMDGIELLQRIRESDPDAEVIMITGHGDMELAIRSLKLEAGDFITKPINDEVMEMALKRASEKIALKKQLREYTENLEHLVAEKTKRLLEAERLAAVGQTVAALAHAIKNVAGGLSGGMFVLEKGIERDNRTYLSQGFEMIRGNVGRIKNMAMDLLSYSREREPDWKRCHPNRPAADVVELMKHRARELGVSLETDLDETLIEACLDPEGIHRCLLDLVTNALDACTELGCGEREPKVIVRSRRVPGWAVEYQVMDTGCGMDPETKSKIFRNFFSTKGSKGTGLGLMMTKKIIEEHGGRISAESEKGMGSRFIIRLPQRDCGQDSTTH